MKDILNRLYRDERLGRVEARELMLRITEDEFPEVQIASLLTVFNMRPINLDELQGFREALLERCVPFDLGDREAIDIVGTGGDGKNTFNISTTSALVVAGAGYKVCKHGSYGVSSSVGSSNVLMELGYQFTNQSERLEKQLDRANICFLHAPLFHPALKAVVPVRKKLGVKTVFNMLGPLVNPAQPTHQMYGTFSLELSRLYSYLMQANAQSYSVVYALDGYDEVSLTGPFKLFSQQGERLLEPEDISMPTYHQQDLHGGETPKEAAEVLLGVLEDRATEAQKNVVLANAALPIQCLCPEKPLEDCVAEAKTSIESGSAKNALEQVLGK